MDQTAGVNSVPGPSPVPNTAQQTPMPSSGKPKRVVYILIIILAALLGIGGYFLGAYVQSKKVPAASTTAQDVGVIPAGFIKTQELIDTGGTLVGKVAIQIPYYGVLSAMDPDKSWTLKGGTKIITIKKQGSEQVRYFRIAAPNALPQPIEGKDLKVGDGILLVTLVDKKTGVVTVANITVTPRPEVQATPSATPTTPKP